MKIELDNEKNKIFRFMDKINQIINNYRTKNVEDTKTIAFLISKKEEILGIQSLEGDGTKTIPVWDNISRTKDLYNDYTKSLSFFKDSLSKGYEFKDSNGQTITIDKKEKLYFKFFIDLYKKAKSPEEIFNLLIDNEPKLLENELVLSKISYIYKFLIDPDEYIHYLDFLKHEMEDILEDLRSKMLSDNRDAFFAPKDQIAEVASDIFFSNVDKYLTEAGEDDFDSPITEEDEENLNQLPDENGDYPEEDNFDELPPDGGNPDEEVTAEPAPFEEAPVAAVGEVSVVKIEDQNENMFQEPFFNVTVWRVEIIGALFNMLQNNFDSTKELLEILLSRSSENGVHNDTEEGEELSAPNTTSMTGMNFQGNEADINALPPDNMGGTAFNNI